MAGELDVLATVVGMDGSQPRAQVVRGLVGEPLDVETVQAPDGADLTFVVFDGVELTIKHDVVTAVIVHTTAGDAHGRYPRVDRLLPGGGATLTRTDLVERLGDPDDLDGQDFFAIGDGSVLADYADGTVTRLTLLPALAD